MTEYIEREALRDALYDADAITMSGVKILNQFPVADVAPVRHGRWVLGNVEPGYFTPGGNRPWICSECEKVISWMLGKPKESYCPNCGAKMGGGAIDGTEHV